jgi:hypothetical protein
MGQELCETHRETFYGPKSRACSWRTIPGVRSSFWKSNPMLGLSFFGLVFDISLRLSSAHARAACTGRPFSHRYPHLFFPPLTSMAESTTSLSPHVLIQLLHTSLKLVSKSVDSFSIAQLSEIQYKLDTTTNIIDNRLCTLEDSLEGQSCRKLDHGRVT